MRSAGLLFENDWRVFILGGAGQSRSIAEGVVCSRSADERAEVSTSCRGFQLLGVASGIRAATLPCRSRREPCRRTRTCSGAGVRVAGVCLRAVRTA